VGVGQEKTKTRPLGKKTMFQDLDIPNLHKFYLLIHDWSWSYNLFSQDRAHNDMCLYWKLIYTNIYNLFWSWVAILQQMSHSDDLTKPLHPGVSLITWIYYNKTTLFNMLTS
jgi:hypothetical protein